LGRGLWLALLLLPIAALSWWLLRSAAPLGGQSLPEEARHSPDYYMEQFTLTSFNELGKPAHKLYADNMLHYPDDDSATLERPHLVVFRDDKEFWDIRADSGLVSGGGEAVLLQGEVIILRVNQEHAQALEVYTSDLMVYPHKKYAETAAAVKIRDDRGVTEAMGMWASLDQRRMELLSNVRGSYAPQNR